MFINIMTTFSDHYYNVKVLYMIFSSHEWGQLSKEDTVFVAWLDGVIKSVEIEAKQLNDGQSVQPDIKHK